MPEKKTVKTVKTTKVESVIVYPVSGIMDMRFTDGTSIFQLDQIKQGLFLLRTLGPLEAKIPEVSES